MGRFCVRSSPPKSMITDFSARHERHSAARGRQEGSRARPFAANAPLQSDFHNAAKAQSSQRLLLESQILYFWKPIATAPGAMPGSIRLESMSRFIHRVAYNYCLNRKTTA